LFGLAVGVPLALIALILAFFGIRSTSDLANLKKTSDELVKQYEPLKAQLPELNKIVEGLRDLNHRVSGVEVAVSVQPRKVAINRYVHDLAKNNNRATLDSIADALGIPKSPNLQYQMGDILLKMDDLVKTATDMDALSARLRPITNKDF
jgi:hypothetical protein